MGLGGAGGGEREPALPARPVGELLCLATAHELKNDLHALYGLLTLIGDAPEFPPAARRQAGRGLKLAESMSRRLRVVAGAILEESGATVSDDREPLWDVVQRSVEAVNLRGGWAGGRQPVEVRGDGGGLKVARPFLVEIAVMNLVTNAVFSTAREAPVPVVGVRVERPHRWEVAVTDHAGGMPEGARRVLLGEEAALAEVDFARPSGRWGFGLILVRTAAAAGAMEVEVGEAAGEPPGTVVRLRGRAAAAKAAGDRGTAAQG
ncbi:MAG TPA: ATP-binding protein [Candidatus Thermoplasmatota archaeon]